MALSNTIPFSSKSILQPCHHSLFPSSSHLQQQQPTFCNPRSQLYRPVSAVHAAEPAKTPAPTPPAAPLRWSIESWKTKTALQLPEYPDEAELNKVLKTLESFPPIVFTGEARNLEERLADAAMGKAFLLQGGDCAEIFKEFSANNIRDTFWILLQMSVVLMFGGQMPIIKVGRMVGQFEKPRSNAYEEKD